MNKNFYNQKPVGPAHPPVSPIHQPVHQPGFQPHGQEHQDDHFTPSAEEIAQRAYAIFVQQGSRPGHDMQHWLEAESQVIAEHHRSHNLHPQGTKT